MARLIIVLAIVLAALVIWYKLKHASPEQRKKIILWSTIWSVVGVLAVLAFTGKLSVITAAIGVLVAMLPRVIGYLKYLPLLSRFYQQAKTGAQSAQQKSSQQSSQQAARNGNMSQAEALAVLGLKPGASREEIMQTHKRMMQKMHPDRGGSDHLAAQINKAKDTLLG